MHQLLQAEYGNGRHWDLTVVKGRSSWLRCVRQEIGGGRLGCKSHVGDVSTGVGRRRGEAGRCIDCDQASTLVRTLDICLDLEKLFEQ